jgi:putative ABC transport system ATP-binding protein
MGDLQSAQPGLLLADDPSAPPMVETRDISRDYPMPGELVHAVRDVSVRVGRGQLVALRGRSGSGKTTFLSMVGALDRPTRGSVSVDGTVVSDLPESQLIDFRRRKIGFIFQGFGLMPILSAAENVEVPLRLVRTEPRERDRRILELLEMVGLGGRANHRPQELSGGEQQRVAIARALANRPDLLLADEPTGQLDSQTGRSIMSLIQHLVRSEGVTAIVATHDPMLIDLADRVIELRDGRLQDDRLATADADAAEPWSAQTAGMDERG